MCMRVPHPSTHPQYPIPTPRGVKSLKCNKSWTNWDNSILFADLWSMEISPCTHTHWSQSLAIAIMSIIHSPTGWLFDNWYIMHNCQFWTFFWHLVSYLNHLILLQGYFYHSSLVECVVGFVSIEMSNVLYDLWVIKCQTIRTYKTVVKVIPVISLLIRFRSPKSVEALWHLSKINYFVENYWHAPTNNKEICSWK